MQAIQLDKNNSLEIARFLKQYNLVNSTNEGMIMLKQGAIKVKFDNNHWAKIIYKEN